MLSRTMKDSARTPEQTQWYVMRDLKRSNAKLPAYKLLEGMEMEVFTPKKWKLAVRQGKRERVEVPFIPDLLFVHNTFGNLNPIVEKTSTLQFRYRKGGGYCQPMTVPEADMERFIHAVSTSENPRYYLPEEITPQMYGKEIHIVGGPLDGYQGRLLTTRGSKVKRLIVELKDFFCVGVEVNPEYIRFCE